MLQLITVSIVMILIGFAALRIAGRKSLSKMTISQSVIMIAIGSILIEPVKAAADKRVDLTIAAIAIFVIVLYLLEVLALKMPAIEKLMIGSEKEVIQQGKIHYQNLTALRMTESQLKTLLREKGIYSMDQIESATIEPNGEIGIRTKAQP